MDYATGPDLENSQTTGWASGYDWYLSERWYSCRWNEPDEDKAIYEQIDIHTSFGIYPCVKITQPDSCRDHAVLFTWGGGGLLNTWKAQLGMAVKLGRDGNVPVYYPIYPLATEHSLLDTMEMIGETYGKLLEEYEADNISVIGVSSGGSQALDLITYINEYRQNLEKLQDHMFHAFPVYPVCRESRDAYRDILAYLGKNS